MEIEASHQLKHFSFPSLDVRFFYSIKFDLVDMNEASDE